jgi:two-component system nitrogen regulation response regulator GlnG
MTSKCVVIIEDDPVFRRGLVKFFQNEDCAVFDFPNADQAVGHLLNQRVDFIVCDYKLPGLNGIEFLTTVMRTESDIPFVLVTAHHSEELFSVAKSLGAVAALAKPLDIRVLRKIFYDTTGIYAKAD